MLTTLSARPYLVQWSMWENAGSIQYVQYGAGHTLPTSHVQTKNEYKDQEKDKDNDKDKDNNMYNMYNMYN